MQKAVNKRMESLLKVTGITKKFQGLVAVDNVSIDMKETPYTPSSDQTEQARPPP